MIIKQINFNWGWSPENGEEFCNYTVGQGGVKSICDWTGDNKVYSVSFDNNEQVLIYNPNLIILERDIDNEHTT